MVELAPNGIITLLTDFGSQDPFVGVMKGVILSSFRSATFVDLTHEIPPQATAQGAFWLDKSFRWFPEGTVHVAVVDPGVGSSRKPVAVRAEGHFFIGPDNGILGAVLEGANYAEVREIDVASLVGGMALDPPSHTFHGRDIFAPAAAVLASGAMPFERLGPPRTSVEPSPIPRPRLSPRRVEGEIVCVDRFGNLIANIGEACLRRLRRPRVQIAGIELPLVATYSAAPDGEYVALVNSARMLEIARRDGNAATTLGLSAGAKVVVVHDI
jgi:S-adenosyl-L-methionine hydrolase (adenosine-forming)